MLRGAVQVSGGRYMIKILLALLPIVGVNQGSPAGAEYLSTAVRSNLQPVKDWRRTIRGRRLAVCWMRIWHSSPKSGGGAQPRPDLALFGLCF